MTSSSTRARPTMGDLRGHWVSHCQPHDCRADHSHSIWLDDRIVALVNPVDDNEVVERIVNLLNASQVSAEMASALEDAKLQIEYLDSKFESTGTSAATLARVDAALSRYRDLMGGAND